MARIVGSVAVGLALPFTPVAKLFGFTALPAGFLAILAVIVMVYICLVEFGKSFFFGRAPLRPSAPIGRWEHPPALQRVERIASRWTVRLRPRQEGPPAT